MWFKASAASLSSLGVESLKTGVPSDSVALASLSSVIALKATSTLAIGLMVRGDLANENSFFCALDTPCTRNWYVEMSVVGLMIVILPSSSVSIGEAAVERL